MAKKRTEEEKRPAHLCNNAGLLGVAGGFVGGLELVAEGGVGVGGLAEHRGHRGKLRLGPCLGHLRFRQRRVLPSNQFLEGGRLLRDLAQRKVELSLAIRQAGREGGGRGKVIW